MNGETGIAMADALTDAAGELGAETGRVSAAEIQTWLITYLSGLLEIPASEVDSTLPFTQFGLDSAAAVAMTGDLGKALDFELDPSLAFEHRTIAAVSEYIASEMRARA